MNKERKMQVRGFTLVELLTVVGIISIVSSISLISWNSYYPVFALDDAAQQIASDLNMTAYQAINTQNQWMAVMIYRFPGLDENSPVAIEAPRYPDLVDTGEIGSFLFWGNSYLLINDDGWMGTGARLFHLRSTDFNIARRNNGKFGVNELIRGPIRFSKGDVGFRWHFLGEGPNEVASPKILVFLPDGRLEAKRDGRVGTAGLLWVADQFYRMNTGPGDVDYNDMMKHRRLIRIRPRAKIEVSYGEGRTL